MKEEIAKLAWILLFAFPFWLMGVPFTPDRAPNFPFVSGDGFRAYAEYVYDETDRSLNPLEVKPGSAVFVKTDYLSDFFSQIHPQIPCPYILITHNSDYSVPGSFREVLDDEKLIVWFGQNIDWEHPKLVGIPIGIANAYWAHGNGETVKRVGGIEGAKRYWLYHNFTIQNYYPERWEVFLLFGQAPFCFRPYRKSFEGYLTDMKASRFVLSPRGNGLDTHRLWEALYVGSFPIVKTSTLDSLYSDLPVVIVSEWEEVTEAFLHKKYEEFLKKGYSIEKSTMGYWICLIEQYKRVSTK